MYQVESLYNQIKEKETMQKTYQVFWKTVEGKRKTDLFVPIHSGWMSLSYVHLCEDTRIQAAKFAGLVLANGNEVLIEVHETERV